MEGPSVETKMDGGGGAGGGGGGGGAGGGGGGAGGVDGAPTAEAAPLLCQIKDGALPEMEGRALMLLLDALRFSVNTITQEYKWET